MNNLPLNSTVQGYDLAQVLRNDEGTFFAQQGSSCFIVTAAEGHSIKSIRPVAQNVQPAQSLGQGPQPWLITKISNDILEQGADLPISGQRRERERANA